MDASFVKKSLNPQGIGFFGGEAVAAIDTDKKVAQSQRLHNIARRIDGLVREHRHQPPHAVCLCAIRLRQTRQCLWNALINRCVVKFVYPVIAEEIVQCLAVQNRGGVFAEGATHESRSTVPHIAGDNVPLEFGATEVAQRSIYRVNQIEAGVNQRAIEIKSQQAKAMGIKMAQKTNHVFSE